MAFRPTQALPAARLLATVAERSRLAPNGASNCRIWLGRQRLPTLSPPPVLATAWVFLLVRLFGSRVQQVVQITGRWRLAGPPAVSFFCQPPDGSSQVPVCANKFVEQAAISRARRGFWRLPLRALIRTRWHHGNFVSTGMGKTPKLDADRYHAADSDFYSRLEFGGQIRVGTMV